MPRLAVLFHIDGNGACGVRKVIEFFDASGHGGAIEESGKGIALPILSERFISLIIGFATS